jgi:DNA-directed RNA polymerase subunit N (RpoN/RPB10)
MDRIKVIGDLWERYLKLLDEGSRTGKLQNAALLDNS